jgi:hypothetical protein
VTHILPVVLVGATALWGIAYCCRDLYRARSTRWKLQPIRDTGELTCMVGEPLLNAAPDVPMPAVEHAASEGAHAVAADFGAAIEHIGHYISHS